MFNIRFRKNATKQVIENWNLQAGDRGVVDGCNAVVVEGLDGELAIRLLDGQIVPASTQRPADGRIFGHGKKGSQHTRPMQES